MVKNMDEDFVWLNQSELTQGSFSITMHNRPCEKKGVELHSWTEVSTT